MLLAYARCDFVMELLKLGEGAELAITKNLNDGVHGLEDGDVAEGEVLRLSEANNGTALLSKETVLGICYYYNCNQKQKAVNA